MQWQLFPIDAVLAVFCPSSEQVFFRVEPRFFIGTFGELRRDTSLDIRRERLVPIKRRLGSCGKWTKLQSPGERARDAAAMEAGAIAGGWDIEREPALGDPLSIQKVVINPSEGDLRSDALANAFHHGPH